MGTTILSFENRIVIETLRHENQSLRYIADYLGFSKTTIFNEIHRLKGEYHATSAQADHETKLSYRGRKCSLTVNLKRLIEEKIKVQKWSIEQVAHVVMIAYKTIYNWGDQGPYNTIFCVSIKRKKHDFMLFGFSFRNCVIWLR